MLLLLAPYASWAGKRKKKKVKRQVMKKEVTPIRSKVSITNFYGSTIQQYRPFSVDCEWHRMFVYVCLCVRKIFFFCVKGRSEKVKEPRMGTNIVCTVLEVPPTCKLIFYRQYRFSIQDVIRDGFFIFSSYANVSSSSSSSLSLGR